MAFKHFKITDPEWLGNCEGVGWAGHEHLFEGEEDEEERECMAGGDINTNNM